MINALREAKPLLRKANEMPRTLLKLCENRIETEPLARVDYVADRRPRIAATYLKRLAMRKH